MLPIRVLALLLIALPAFAADPPDPSLRFGALLFQDDFRNGLEQWHVETEKAGRIEARFGALDIDVPAGATLWFKHELKGRVAIVFEATAVAAGGRNDRVSDLGCFWMARNRDGKAPVFAQRRSGRIDGYDDLSAYFVGLGSNRNTITRFRRYAGEPVLRSLAPEHDLSSLDALLAPNRRQTITVIADNTRIEYWRNSQRLFRFVDDAPYTQGWFGLRTTHSHLRIARFRVYALN